MLEGKCFPNQNCLRIVFLAIPLPASCDAGKNNNKQVEEDYVSVDLLMVANKYNIQKLMSACQEHLLEIMDNTNAMDIMVAAYLNDNTEMLKTCTEYVIRNRAQVMKNERWKEIKRSHPELATSIVETMLESTELIAA
jgi:hypothetical protein